MTRHQDEPVIKEAKDLLVGEMLYQKNGAHQLITEVRDNGIFTNIAYRHNTTIRNRIYRSDDAVYVIMPLDTGERVSKNRLAC